MDDQSSGSEASQHNFALRPAAFEQRVGTAQVLGIDLPHVRVSSRSNTTRVDQIAHFLQQPTLLLHVGSLEERAREHELAV